MTTPNEPTVKRGKLSELTPDPQNINAGTIRGDYMMETSIQSVGLGRSIVVDKNGVIIAGDKTSRKANELGIDDIILVDTTGDELVVVRRTDLDLVSENQTERHKARMLAVMDNRVSELNYEVDDVAMRHHMADGFDFKPMYFENELAYMLGDDVEPMDVDEALAGGGDVSHTELMPTIRLKVKAEIFQRYEAMRNANPEITDEQIAEHIINLVD